MLRLKNYYKPTPKRLRKLGDSLLAVSMMAIPTALSGHVWLGSTVFALGVIGKFLTNFFAEDEN